MKSSITSTTITLSSFALIVVTLSSISFLPLSQSKILIQETNKNDHLIAQTCAKTPNFTLCISTLRSNPKSASANDLKGLALIMVASVKAKAKETLSHIDALLKEGDHSTTSALRHCSDNYKAVLEGDVPEAVEAIKSSDYKFAEQGMSDVEIESHLCQSKFLAGIKCPFADSNKAMHDLAAIATSMVRMLMIG